MKDIMLKITGRQADSDSDENVLEFVTEGKLYERQGSLYYVYDESEFSGMPGCKTSIRLSGDSVRMNRVGEENSGNTAIEFEQGKRYIGYYQTPFGPIEMEVLTNSMKKALDSEGLGTIDIDYSVSLKGLTESRTKLNIEVR